MEGIGAEEEEMVLTYFSAQKFVLSEKDCRLSDSGNIKRKLWNLNLEMSQGLYSKVL